MKVSDPLSREVAVCCAECLIDLDVVELSGQWWCACTWDDRDALCPVEWLTVEAVAPGTHCATCRVVDCITEFMHGEWIDIA